MPRPHKSTTHKSTTHELEDKFADMPVADQARLLETFAAIHRLANRQDKRERKPAKTQPAAIAAEQPSLTGLPDEDQI